MYLPTMLDNTIITAITDPSFLRWHCRVLTTIIGTRWLYRGWKRRSYGSDSSSGSGGGCSSLNSTFSITISIHSLYR